jgi:MYXO-CTERM domain-containing protein
MLRSALAALALALCATSPARADTLPLLEGVPDTYSPGTAFSFTVRVPALFDLSSYSLDLVFATEVANPPLFASASAALTTADGGRYVFPSNAGFRSTLTTFDGGTEILLTLADRGALGDTNRGSNDTLALVTVTPGTTFAGPITISVGADTLFEANFENGTPPGPEPFTVKQAGDTGGGGDPNPVPAPPAVALFALGALALLRRKRA